jgi:phenylpropionate dioxygenase-like ring-hydroxylating dioxygenase large terminal subunit
MAATENGIRRATSTFALPDWPKNAWYPAAYDVELKKELLARTIAGHTLVFYRRRDNRPVALENACWHRLLPLSKGHTGFRDS